MSRRVHVLMKKEELDAERLPGKVVIVLDVLFATTTIAAALAAGAYRGRARARCRRRARRGQGARRGQLRALGRACGPRRIAGLRAPHAARAHAPAPLAGKSLIYSTTNGTVALAKSAGAGARVRRGARERARRGRARAAPASRRDACCSSAPDPWRTSTWRTSTAPAISRGSSPTPARASISPMPRSPRASCTTAPPPLECLRESRVGRMMLERGLDAEIAYAATADSLAVVPRLEAGRLRRGGDAHEGGDLLAPRRARRRSRWASCPIRSPARARCWSR